MNPDTHRPHPAPVYDYLLGDGDTIRVVHPGRPTCCPWPASTTSSPGTASPSPTNPHLRLAQYRANNNPEHRLRLSRAFVAGKLHNYRQRLLRAARDNTGPRQTRLRDTTEHHATALIRLEHTRGLDEFLGIEGNATREYFQALDHLAPGTAPGRSRRPPTDPVNCLLCFG